MVLGIVMVLGFAVFCTQTPVDARHRPWRGPHVSSDGWYYFHSLRSLALDGDLDLSNEYREFGNWYGFEPGSTGRPRNPFGVGPAIAWMPGFVLGHGVAVVRGSEVPWRRAHGYSPPEQFGALLVSYLAGCLTLGLTYRVARRFYDPAPALLGSLGATLGGPLAWYAVYEPSMPHALAAATATATLASALPLRARSVRSAAVLGALLGLATLMRPQHGVLAVLPFVECIAVVRRDSSQARAATMRLGITAAVASIVFAPQLMAWKAIYGQWLVVPQGAGFMRWTEPMVSAVLFSSRNGLFTSTPILWIACMLGVPLLWRRHRATTVALALFLLSQAYVNGAAWDWWGGGAYGGRRMLGSSLLFALGLAACTHAVVAGRRHARLKTIIAVGFISAFCVPQLRVVAAYARREIRFDDPRPIAAQYGPALGPGPAAIVERLGNPFAFPANVLFSLRHGVPLSRFDHAVGPYLLNERLPTTNPRRARQDTAYVRLSSEDGLPFAGSGVQLQEWGARIEDEGTLFVPLNRPGGMKVSARVDCEHPATVAVQLNGGPTHRLALSPPSGTVSFEVDADSVARGINTLSFEVSTPVVVRHLLLTEGEDWPPAWVETVP